MQDYNITTSNEAEYTLWLGPSGKLAGRLQNKIRKLSDRHGTPLFEPHITLLTKIGPNLATMKSRMESLANSFDPLRLQLQQISYGEDYYHVVYVTVEKSAKLMQLREQTCGLFEQMEKNYEPHFSLIYGDFSTEQKRKIGQKLVDIFSGKIDISSLILMKSNGLPKYWKRIHKVDF